MSFQPSLCFHSAKVTLAWPLGTHPDNINEINEAKERKKQVDKMTHIKFDEFY